MTATASETTTRWSLSGTGYEYCNCNPGCTCNFNGFPSSSDGSCKALVANVIEEGRCGDVDLAGVTAVALIDRLVHHALVVVTSGESLRMLGARGRGGVPPGNA